MTSNNPPELAECLTSKALAMQYPVKGSMPLAVVHQLYQLREAEVERLSQRDVIVVGDLQGLDRGARAVLATMLFKKCDGAARHALLHDEHPHVRTCAVLSQSELETVVEPVLQPSVPANPYQLLQAEFPHYDVGTLPALPTGFVDSSWHNDACPSFTNEERRIQVFVDYADPMERECGPEACRFSLFTLDEHGDTAYISNTNQWGEMLALIEQHATK
jgi:hypothetical protein